MTITTLTGPYSTTITPGVNNYGLDLTFDATATVLPTTIGAAGVFASAGNVSLTLDGLAAGTKTPTVQGASGNTSYAGGIGIDLTTAATVTIDATPQGTLNVVGGFNEYAGFAAGAGVSMTGGGTLNNNGNIAGGEGGGAAGAVGVLASAGTIVNNAGSINGGNDNTYYTAGGAGVSLSGGAQLFNTGTIFGAHGYGNQTGHYSNGGAGILLTGANTYAQDSGGIYGGRGAYTGTAGAGAQLSNSAAMVVAGTKTLHGGSDYDYNGVLGNYWAGSHGGAGAQVYSSATLTIAAGAYVRGGIAATAGVGVYIDGGTVVNSGTIVSGAVPTSTPGVYTYNSAVQFGPAAGSDLVLHSGSDIAGAISGFGTNDTIDAADWGNKTGTSGPFASTTATINTYNDGTLTFTGLTPGDSFQYTYDGSGGTDFTVIAPPSLTTVNQQVVIGSANYPSPLTIGTGGTVGTVAPSGTAGVAAVVSDLSFSTLNVNAQGSITGGTGNTSNDTFVAGAGVSLGDSNVTVNTGGSVTGGYGDEDVKGGLGVDISSATVGGITSLSNYGTITGGAGNIGGGGGVSFSSQIGDIGQSSTFVNSGRIYGGSGAAGEDFGSFAAGGYGASVSLTGDYLKNSGLIEGGFGGEGGTGLVLSNGASANNAGGTIEGAQSQDIAEGAGVGLYGGAILTTSGLIEGGTGALSTTADAVTFNYESGATTNLEELRIYSGASFKGDIAGFGSPGSYVDIANWSRTGTSARFTSSTYTLATSDGNLTFTGLTVGDEFMFGQFGASGTQITVACYRRGTRIRTEQGEQTIESLYIGDRVMTRSGTARPIRWIGRRRYSGVEVASNPRVLPIRICAGALGEDSPRRDLWVSPEHAMWIKGQLIPARDLTNGSSIYQERSVAEVTYYHLEFDTHDVIYAEGAPSESFVDDESREHFDNVAEYRSRFPGALRTAARFCAPRVEEGVALEAVRTSLRLRAAPDCSAR